MFNTYFFVILMMLDYALTFIVFFYCIVSHSDSSVYSECDDVPHPPRAPPFAQFKRNSPFEVARLCDDLFCSTNCQRNNRHLLHVYHLWNPDAAGAYAKLERERAREREREREKEFYILFSCIMTCSYPTLVDIYFMSSFSRAKIRFGAVTQVSRCTSTA